VPALQMKYTENVEKMIWSHLSKCTSVCKWLAYT